MLKTVSKAYGVAGIRIHYGIIFKIVCCSTEELLHSLNISWWVAGTCCLLQRRAEKAGGTFPSVNMAWHRHMSYGTATHLSRLPLERERRSSPLRRQGCKYCANILCTRLCLESSCTSGLHQQGPLLCETSSVLGALGMLGCLRLPLGHSSDLWLLKALQPSWNIYIGALKADRKHFGVKFSVFPGMLENSKESFNFWLLCQTKAERPFKTNKQASKHHPTKQTKAPTALPKKPPPKPKPTKQNPFEEENRSKLGFLS